MYVCVCLCLTFLCGILFLTEKLILEKLGLENLLQNPQSDNENVTSISGNSSIAHEDGQARWTSAQLSTQLSTNCFAIEDEIESDIEL